MGTDVQGSAVRKAITAYNTEVPLIVIANAQQLKAQIHHVCRTGSVAMCHPLDLIGSVVPTKQIRAWYRSAAAWIRSDAHGLAARCMRHVPIELQDGVASHGSSSVPVPRPQRNWFRQGVAGIKPAIAAMRATLLLHGSTTASI